MGGKPKPRPDRALIEGRWLSVDPGEDTGWSLWEGEELIDLGMAKMREFEDALFDAMFTDPMEIELTDNWLAKLFIGVQGIVCENWRIYPKEAKMGALDWDECRTARLIGAIQLICRRANIWYETQPAAIKERAMAAGADMYFLSPRYENRHANDAVMHAVYFRALINGAVPLDGLAEDGRPVQGEEALDLD